MSEPYLCVDSGCAKLKGGEVNPLWGGIKQKRDFAGSGERGGGRKKNSACVQGYLAHKKTPTPLGPPQEPGHKPTERYRGTSLIRNAPLLGPFSRTTPRVLWWSQGGGAVSYEQGTPCSGGVQHKGVSPTGVASKPEPVLRIIEGPLEGGGWGGVERSVPCNMKRRRRLYPEAMPRSPPPRTNLSTLPPRDVPTHLPNTLRVVPKVWVGNSVGISVVMGNSDFW